MLRPLAIGAMVCAAALLGAGTAAADPIFTYDVTKGTSHVKKTNSQLPLGPGSLVVDLDGASGNFTAEMTLPPVKSEFKVIGFIPATATVTMEQVGITGTLIDGVVTSRALVNIKLSDVKTLGIPLFVGDKCRTATPAVIDLHSAPDFNALEGGDLLAPNYTIPQFKDCNLATGILNGLIPGPDNTLSLTLAIKW
jgi:hypothetical protein